MEKRTLGRTGLDVTVVGFGALAISGNFFGPADDTVSNRALHEAVDAGMNFIDTSVAYGQGHSEEVIGKFLRERPDRDRILIGTKGGHNFVTGKRNFAPDYIRECFEGSLQRLGVDAIDLYLLHNPTLDNLRAQESFDLLDELVSQGKLKNWGVSVNTLPECEWVVSSGRPSVIQMGYNILEQGAAGVFAQAKKAGVGVISRVPLMRGLLSGRFKEDHVFEEGDRRGQILAPEKIRAFQANLNTLQKVAADLGRSAAEVAIRFCVSNPNISTVIPGIRTPEQSKANAAAWEPLPQDLLERLQKLSQQEKTAP